MDAKAELRELLKGLKEEYRYEKPDEFDEGDILVRKLKWIISNKLTVAERTIILLYAETGSLRKLGNMLKCSHSTIRPEVNRIKELIICNLNALKNNEML